ncbi:MAG: GAF domain-containing protein [Acidobacteria bacterium]|nr:GAF domain-containing protein [Acidobacteriota bacterium]
MVQFDNQSKQVKLKVVYYGPALGGKTTSLQHVHRVTDPSRRTKLYALNTASDRTLFFDLLALDLGRVRGYRVTLQLFTVPGQVQYNATRRAVLAGADGIVFVADSQRAQARANEESLANLAENLRSNGLDPDVIPIVLQYNKRDLPDAMGRAEAERSLNPRGSPAFETVATTGFGVMEAFIAIVQAAVVSVGDRLGLSERPEAIPKLLDSVRAALLPLLPGTGSPAAEPAVVLRPVSGNAALDQDELLAEAVRANMAMTDLTARLDRLSQDLDRRVGQLRAINEFGRLMSQAREPEEVTSGILDRLLADLRVASGSLLLVNEEGELVEILRRGLEAEPMLQADSAGRPAIAAVLETRQPAVTRLDDLETGQLAAAPWLTVLQELGLVAALAVPLVAQDRAVGVVTCYADASRGAFEDEDLELASVLAGNAATAMANARAWRSLEQLNRSLEDAVAARTRELEQALVRAHGLAEEVEDRNAELKAANLQLRDLERLKGDLLDRVAHELNTPVTAIQTAARILAKYEEVPAERAARFVGIIEREATRLAELIASALQAVVLGLAEGRPAAAPVVVADLLRRVLAPLKGEINERRLALQVRVAAGLDSVEGDGEQLESALRAVVRNAVEFSREGGAVTLTVRPVRRDAGSWVEMRVQDAGVGIAPEDLPHVTEVFWQGGNMLTGKPHGLGLGLAVARRVAENHGGELEIVSAPDAGTTVTLLLPRGPA